MKPQSFRAEILDGHKGAAVIVPFDPAATWGSAPAAVPAPWKLGHLVRGTLAGQPFDGWIGKRWGRHFLLVDESLQRKAGVSIGDVVSVSVAPRDDAKPRSAAKPSKASKASKPSKPSKPRKPRKPRASP